MNSPEENLVEIEVDGIALQATPGQMLIEVTDRADIYVPRFCYHSKLSVAANCRMCLVDVEKAPKPLPACATPVTDGMKVFTRSARALSAQKATMEFLLINHPLDCPICDQGGECELQDLAVGFGRGVSRYTERKRVVKDKNLGPLVSTDMTRCIHCTRCVRFGQEIAGIQELGAVGRSEDMEIGTYVEKAIDHEMSGNVIDLCPVGALNNKPYRFSARAWEMAARPMIAPHDCVGSNLYGHVLRGRLRRVVPRDNESINETWISDRDRFACFGIDTPDRLQQPMIKTDQQWRETSWQVALEAAQSALLTATAGEPEAVGILVSPNATLEEQYLLSRIAQRIGTRNIDHRFRRQDFEDQTQDPAWPYLGCSIEELSEQDGIVVIGSNVRNEVPIIAHRLRTAATANQASIAFVNPERYTYHFPVAGYTVASAEAFVAGLAGVVVAAAKLTGRALPSTVAESIAAAETDDSHRATAAALIDKRNALILVGHIAQRHPCFSSIRVLANALSEITGAKLGYIGDGGNAAGAALAGCQPHRDVGGERSDSSGLDAAAMLQAPRRVYVMFGIEPEQGDVSDVSLTRRALDAADKVICLTPYVTETLKQNADILLPVGTYAETPGTFVNAEGRWQSFDAAATPIGDARAGWRVLRVLGNLLDVENCEYRQSTEVRDELRSLVGDATPENRYDSAFRLMLDPLDVSLEKLDLNGYSVDAVVRRSTPLQTAAGLIEPIEPSIDQVSSA